MVRSSFKLQLISLCRQKFRCAPENSVTLFIRRNLHIQFEASLWGQRASCWPALAFFLGWCWVVCVWAASLNGFFEELWEEKHFSISPYQSSTKHSVRASSG